MKIFLVLLSLCTLYGVAQSYSIGVGRADITGPPVEIVFMGYAHIPQRGHGIHLRQYSRAFIVENNGKRVVFVSIDGAMMTNAIGRDVVARLQTKYGDLYSIDNIIISSTHTHGTPGGFMMYFLYDASIFGFVGETYRAILDGIYLSIVRAHDSMEEGSIYHAEIDILDASINRSPTSYLANPPEERSQYTYDTDKTLTQLRFVTKNNGLIGAINWFAVHPTSMNNTNHYVSSDNVGYSSLLLEKKMNPDSLPGKGKFVGAFAAANLGDISPNIMGPKCEYTGLDCDLLSAPCPEGAGQCFASGPGNDMMESTKIIGTRIYEGAAILIDENRGREVTGDVKYIHQFVDMPAYRGSFYNRYTRKLRTIQGCSPAMGYSFAAGTTDGPASVDIANGEFSDNPIFNTIRDALAEPTAEDISCHAPKPILLATGRATFPFEPWQPNILPTQLFQIGDVIITALPGEFTTMAGRRVRAYIKDTVREISGGDATVILAGLSNLYSSYVSTYEEYQLQRYEAGSTAYGPDTLAIYINQFQKLARAMYNNEEVDSGPSPPNLDDRVLTLNTPVLYDGSPIGRRFGDVTRQPHDSHVGGKVTALFISGNPRNDLQHEKTYFTIERQSANGDWIIVANDANWETLFRWTRTSILLAHSTVEVVWNIPEDAEPGVYRICHFGASRALLQGTTPYVGITNNFIVSA